MLKIITGVAAAALLVAVTANVAEAHKSRAGHSAGEARVSTHLKASARARHAWGNYRDMRSFNERPGFYAFAYKSELNRRPAPLMITSFPMPFTVWW
jgi:hypothetical protein